MVFRTKCEISRRVITKRKLTCVVYHCGYIVCDAKARNQYSPRWDLLDFERRLHVGILFDWAHFCLFGVLLCLQPLVHWFCLFNWGNTFSFPIILHFYVTFFLPKCVIRRVLRVLPLALEWLWLGMLDGWRAPWDSALEFYRFFVCLFRNFILSLYLWISSLDLFLCLAPSFHKSQRLLNWKEWLRSNSSYRREHFR